MAISGDSMATPHVGGMAGLILDVAPSLSVADYHREDHDFGDSLVGGEGTTYGQFENWATENFSRIHELELILELTASLRRYGNSCEDGNDEDSCSEVFQNSAMALAQAVPWLACRTWPDRYRCGCSACKNSAIDARPRRQWYCRSPGVLVWDMGNLRKP